MENLEILIVSTPRTGNTWIKYCLSLIYDLPVVDFHAPEFWRPFDAHPYDQLGRRWIAHQHLPPFESLVRWARDRGLVLITTIQHPADTLVSLYHYVRNFRERTQSEQIAFCPLDFMASDESREAYYPWLNSVSDRDPSRERIPPTITNLGTYLYQKRSDLQTFFPDLYGADRVAFSHSFTEINFIGPPALDAFFTVPVYQSWLDGPRPSINPVQTLE